MILFRGESNNMQLEINKTKISGCYELLPLIRRDDRGSFIKTFHKDVFEKHNLETNFVEEYYSTSTKGVLRGLHFQIPPHDHVKMVYCVEGEVVDVVVDLRVGSPTYGQFEMFNLSSDKANIIYIPQGLAHGFYVVSEKVTLLYKVSTVYSQKHDSGILWNSVGIPWPNHAPIISARDEGFCKLEQLSSPFSFNNGGI